jgi:transcriptional regulator with XRE-family HTH domain
MAWPKDRRRHAMTADWQDIRAALVALLRDHSIRRYISRQAIADSLNVDKRTVGRWLSGEDVPPRDKQRALRAWYVERHNYLAQVLRPAMQRLDDYIRSNRQAGATRRKMAGDLGITLQTLNSWLAGNTHPPPATLQQIVDFASGRTATADGLRPYPAWMQARIRAAASRQARINAAHDAELDSRTPADFADQRYHGTREDD